MKINLKKKKENKKIKKIFQKINRKNKKTRKLKIQENFQEKLKLSPKSPKDFMNEKPKIIENTITHEK